VLISAGAGGKADPTRLRISALSDCINDPLAAKIKWKLKKHGVPAEEVVSLFSVEKPICELLPLTAEQQANPQVIYLTSHSSSYIFEETHGITTSFRVKEFGAVDYLRVRVIPVLGTSPSIFGQSLASYVLCKLAG
jgi:tRNA A37 threonylcarbamoyladenosine dehydratase